MPLSEEENQKMQQKIYECISDAVYDAITQKIIDVISPIIHEYTTVSAKTLEQAVKTETTEAVEDVKKNFPEDLQNLLNFEETPDLIIIKPKSFLGSENFAKIAFIVRGIGGDYVSAGKASHFRVPKKKVD